MASSPRWKRISISRVPPSLRSAEPSPLASSISSKPCQVKKDGPRGVLAIEAATDPTEGKFSVAVAVEGDVGWLHEVEVVAVPQVGLDDALLADHRAGHAAAHRCVPSRCRHHRRPYAGTTSSTPRPRSPSRRPRNAPDSADAVPSCARRSQAERSMSRKRSRFLQNMLASHTRSSMPSPTNQRNVRLKSSCSRMRS